MSLSSVANILIYSKSIKGFTEYSTPLFKKMMVTMASTLNTPSHLISYLLENCNTMDQLKQGHGQAIKRGLASQPVVQTRIIAYCCGKGDGDMSHACKVFETMSEPVVFVWNSMIKGYSRIALAKNGLLTYIEMLEKAVTPDGYTFPFLLKGFTRKAALAHGRELHCHVVKFGLDSNGFVQNAFVHMYSLCGMMDMAHRVFDRSCKKDVFSWNEMFSGYNRLKQYQETRILFHEMQTKLVPPTSVTLVLVLSACSKLKDLGLCKRVHSYVKECGVEPDLVLGNALIDAYGACAEIDPALQIFENMKNPDVISWTSIIKAFIRSGKLDLARTYFDRMPKRDTVSWTNMINGYLWANRFKESLELFRDMQNSGIEPDEFTVVSILTACAQLGSLETGEWIKAYIDRKRLKKDAFVGNALIDMYFKCGCIEKARKMFKEIKWRDKYTWTAMVVGLAINGHGKEALNFFAQMLDNLIEPDEITYIGVLSACTHTGMVGAGRRFFARMITEHGIEPSMAHYGCLVDLLGRAGYLQEAYEVLINMPIKPSPIVWGALLGACRVHKDSALAALAAKKILEMDPDNDTAYVSLCNTYAVCNKWDELHEVRRTMMEKQIKKTPGCSLIEIKGVVHEFISGDQSHVQSEEINAKLEEMIRDLMHAGYSPDISEVLIDLGEEDKECTLYRHSEKLAMAFGLICSEPGNTIRIMKNLRMCMDCHRVAKLVSKLYNREVVVRDRTRFHHFKNGSCSCKDFW